MSQHAERCLYAEFVALPGSEGTVTALVKQLVPDVRNEPGCLQFEAYRRQDDPAHWVVFETYRDEAAFQSHLSTSHSRAFNVDVAAHIVGGTSSLVWLTKPDFTDTPTVAGPHSA